MSWHLTPSVPYHRKRSHQHHLELLTEMPSQWNTPQAQSTDVRQWEAAGVGERLLGDLRSRSVLGLHLSDAYSVIYLGPQDMPNRLHPSIPAGQA